jgi:hypothetical protein
MSRFLIVFYVYLIIGILSMIILIAKIIQVRKHENVYEIKEAKKELTFTYLWCLLLVIICVAQSYTIYNIHTFLSLILKR